MTATSGFEVPVIDPLRSLRLLGWRPAHTALACIALAGLALACTGEVRTEDPPIDTRDNVHVRGLFDCTESQDTGYSQGDAFAIDVVTVDGKPVEVETANAYIVMQQAAQADGVELRIVSGFRTMAQQEYFYGCYVNCNCNNCNLAAPPGYSNHQSGHALDLNTSDPGVLTWLNNHGAGFGFERTVPSENWHWEWWGGGPGGGPCGADPECLANPNAGGCDGSVITHCDDTNHLSSGDCGAFGAACSTAGGAPHCVHPYCLAETNDGENGTFCADGTRLATCTWGAYSEGDCGAYGATCSDAGGAGHCVHYLCWTNLDGGEDGSFCHEGQRGSCALGALTLEDCAQGTACAEDSGTSASCRDPSAPPEDGDGAGEDDGGEDDDDDVNDDANGDADGAGATADGDGSPPRRVFAKSVEESSCASAGVPASLELLLVLLAAHTRPRRRRRR